MFSKSVRVWGTNVKDVVKVFPLNRSLEEHQQYMGQVLLNCVSDEFSVKRSGTSLYLINIIIATCCIQSTWESSLDLKRHLASNQKLKQKLVDLWSTVRYFISNFNSIKFGWHKTSQLVSLTFIKSSIWNSLATPLLYLMPKLYYSRKLPFLLPYRLHLIFRWKPFFL